MIKDELLGQFSTHQIEKHWNVQVFNSPYKKLGWGVNTFIPLITQDGKRSLYMDADIVWLGDLTKTLEQFNQDIVVSPEFIHPSDSHITKTYFDKKELLKDFPDYAYPGFHFNCGQILLTQGCISKEQLEPFIDFSSSPPQVKNKTLFHHVDQSILNYLIPSLADKAKITLEKHVFQIWAWDQKEMARATLKNLTRKNQLPFLIHWAGHKPKQIRNMPGSEILRFFEANYYAVIPLGGVLILSSRFKRARQALMHLIKKKFIGVKNTFKG